MSGTSITLEQAMRGIEVTYPMKVSKNKSDSLTMLKMMMDNVEDASYFGRKI